ncbi:hypothetical protein DPMN_137694 [Dreissena polymorpha]|uniref:Uncharacterized protein n=1 Tax=Dreissena polymorpha TaxID=45954 RepID=A0A9D4JDW6_DREPO|nr:hypothetical protein DPMN_137694 [Dreissena polymorpha]
MLQVAPYPAFVVFRDRPSRCCEFLFLVDVTDEQRQSLGRGIAVAVVGVNHDLVREFVDLFEINHGLGAIFAR